MGFLSSAFFWGGLVVLIGLSIMLHAMGIKFPLFRFALGVFFIWLGLSIIFGAVRRTGGRDRSVVFDSRTVTGHSGGGEYSTIFGSSVVDLTGYEPGERDERVEVNAIFGEARVLVDVSKPVRVSGTAAFGHSVFPDGSSIAFGEAAYESSSFRKGEPALVLKVSAVFGQVRVDGVRSVPKPKPDTVPAG